MGGEVGESRGERNCNQDILYDKKYLFSIKGKEIKVKTSFPKKKEQ